MVLQLRMAALLLLLGLPVFLPRHASADGAAPTLRDHSIAVPILAELLKTDDGLASEVPCTGDGTIAHSNRAAGSNACVGLLGAECAYSCNAGYFRIGRHVCQSYAQGGQVFLDRQWFGGRCERLCTASASPCPTGLVPTRVNSTDAGGPSSTTTILGRFQVSLPKTLCMLNRQRERTLPRPTVAPTATSSTYF